MSAMTETPQAVLVTDGFSEPLTAKHNFTNRFDLSDPERAMSEYQRIIYEHTKRQLSIAKQSARRRSGASTQSSESIRSTSS